MLRSQNNLLSNSDDVNCSSGLRIAPGVFQYFIILEDYFKFDDRPRRLIDVNKEPGTVLDTLDNERILILQNPDRFSSPWDICFEDKALLVLDSDGKLSFRGFDNLRDHTKGITQSVSRDKLEPIRTEHGEFELSDGLSVLDSLTFDCQLLSTDLVLKNAEILLRYLQERESYSMSQYVCLDLGSLVFTTPRDGKPTGDPTEFNMLPIKFRVNTINNPKLQRLDFDTRQVKEPLLKNNLIAAFTVANYFANSEAVIALYKDLQLDS